MINKRVYTYAFAVLGTSVAGYVGYRYYRQRKDVFAARRFQRPHSIAWRPDTRSAATSKLKSKRFDLLIIGGGATGAGCALDAATRGLDVALVEYGDFSSETSSKSTKLLHGGVRYLDKALKTLSLTQFKFVAESLRERMHILNISPYLAQKLPIMLPVYNYISIPYFYAGLLLYDFIAGKMSLGRSFIMGRTQTLKEFPSLQKEGLKGSIVYYDAQQNDARNNLMIALTSAYYGATVLNYVEVVDLIKENGQVVGARCVDRATGEAFDVRAKGVINATGAFTDNIRSKNGNTDKIMVQSSGTHIVLPRRVTPRRMGMIDPDTTDGRVLFFIPWRGKAVVGTTDNSCELKREIKPTDADIDFILRNAKNYISNPALLTRKSILSAWCGIRPLVKDVGSENTEAIMRSHMVRVDNHKLLSVSGGKWTTYRKMAEDTINKAIEVFDLRPKRGCVSKYVKILGGNGYTKSTVRRIMRELDVSPRLGKHLNDTYGLRALKLKEYSRDGRFSYLSNKYLFLKEEVEYAVDNEMAIKGHDILARRMGLGFIDVREAGRCVDAVCRIMREKLGWTKEQEKSERRETYEYLKTLGLGLL